MGEDLLAKQRLDTACARRADPAKGGGTLRPSALVLSEAQGEIWWKSGDRRVVLRGVWDRWCSRRFGSFPLSMFASLF